MALGADDQRCLRKTADLLHEGRISDVQHIDHSELTSAQVDDLLFIAQPPEGYRVTKMDLSDGGAMLVTSAKALKRSGSKRNLRPEVLGVTLTHHDHFRVNL